MIKKSTTYINCIFLTLVFLSYCIFYNLIPVTSFMPSALGFYQERSRKNWRRKSLSQKIKKDP